MAFIEFKRQSFTFTEIIIASSSRCEHSRSPRSNNVLGHNLFISLHIEKEDVDAVLYCPPNFDIISTSTVMWKPTPPFTRDVICDDILDCLT